MTKQQAWQILVNVCQGISATREGFRILDEALETLKPEITEEPKEQ